LNTGNLKIKNVGYPYDASAIQVAFDPSAAFHEGCPQYTDINDIAHNAAELYPVPGPV